jgi:hypothetical protein
MNSRAYHLIRGGVSKALTFAHDVLRNPDLQSLLFWRIVDLIDAVKIISNVASSGLVIWVVTGILKGVFGCVLPRADVEWQQYCLQNSIVCIAWLWGKKVMVARSGQ